ncbi:MAG: transposase [bacterium]|nr:transposase [bacterium]
MATTALYRIVSDHLDEFLAHADAHDRVVPKFVVDEFASFLTCGILEHGFAIAQCGHCQTQRLVPFSCKGRGLCPSCIGRTMCDTAARLVDYTVPHVPVRQWVLSLPHGLRFVLAYDPPLCAEVLRIFTDEVFAWLRRTAVAAGDVGDDDELHCGSVTAIHRADSACKLNLHYHTLALDGVFVRSDGDSKPRFVATPAPGKADISAVAWSVCLRTMQLLKDRGLAIDATADDLDPDYGQGTLLHDPLLSQCAAASMLGVVLMGPHQGRQVLRLGGGPTAVDSYGRAAHGFDLHAARRISAQDRSGLERLCRYLLRPALSHDRVQLTQQGKVKLRLKRAWSDGTSHLIFSPLDFLARMVPLIPPPRMHRVRYHGVLSSHSKLRPGVVPKPPPHDEAEQLHLFKQRRRKGGYLAPAAPHRIRWAKLMARVFGLTPLCCPTCSGTMRIVDFVTEPRRIVAIMRQHGLQPANTVAHRPRGPPQLELPFGMSAQATA